MKTLLVAALMLAAVVAQAQVSLTTDDRAQIQSLVARYASALGSCDAGGFADLFAPEGGFFASGFRGKVEGRARLVALVESERHCLAANPDGSRGRPGGQNTPTASLTTGPEGVFGSVDLGMAQYLDEYVETPKGWLFMSRTVVIAAERAAGVDAAAMAAIRELSADVPARDRYVADDGGKERFISSGVVIRVEEGIVRGRVYLDDGSHYDDVYEQTAAGKWRIRSRERVAAATN
jgi:hypothetical protein